MKLDFDKSGGLIPAIIQHARTGQVLMLGYMNAQAVAQTQETRKVTFYSRSRDKLWVKGETSGNFLDLVNMETDCDNDTLLVQAIPNGPTCHQGTPSCFGDDSASGIGFLEELSELIVNRKNADPGSSYTARLLQGPLAKAAQKVGEEGVETALAAVAQDKPDLIYESADLLYHLLVLLAARDIELQDVMAELKSRHGK